MHPANRNESEEIDEDEEAIKKREEEEKYEVSKRDETKEAETPVDLRDFSQSNIEGEIVGLIQNSRKNFDGMIINAAAFTHTSVAIRDALSIFKVVFQLELSRHE